MAWHGCIGRRICMATRRRIGMAASGGASMVASGGALAWAWLYWAAHGCMARLRGGTAWLHGSLGQVLAWQYGQRSVLAWRGSIGRRLQRGAQRQVAAGRWQAAGNGFNGRLEVVQCVVFGQRAAEERKESRKEEMKESRKESSGSCKWYLRMVTSRARLAKTWLVVWHCGFLHGLCGSSFGDGARLVRRTCLA